jgi:hypothetical protein
MQTIDFPSFQNKDQSKGFDQYSENYKKNDENLKWNKESDKKGISDLISKNNRLNTILLIGILIVGLIIIIQK